MKFEVVRIQFAHNTMVKQCYNIVNVQQKSNGPRALSCTSTTPPVNCFGLEKVDPTRTHCVLLFKNSPIHLNKLPHIPKRLSLWSNFFLTNRIIRPRIGLINIINATVTDWRLSSAKVQSLRHSSKLVTVDRFAKKPCC